MSWFDAENEQTVYWRVKVIHWIVFTNWLLSIAIVAGLALILASRP